MFRIISANDNGAEAGLALPPPAGWGPPGVRLRRGVVRGKRKEGQGGRPGKGEVLARARLWSPKCGDEACASGGVQLRA